jgi:hypothetical protein
MSTGPTPAPAPAPSPAPAHPFLANLLAEIEALAQSPIGQALIALLLSKLTPATADIVKSELHVS